MKRRLITYNEFFRFFVQRRRNELVNPKFMNLGELTLPRNSLIHFIPREKGEVGPSNNEALISTYPGDVFIEFDYDFEPIIGKGRKVATEVRKVIKDYRGKHYNYNWTKEINTVYKREKILVVKSYGIIDRIWVARPTMFNQFETYYDKFSMLMDKINAETEKGDRHQFLRIDLPNHIPGFMQLLIDYDNYLASFKDGLPTPNNRALRLTKGEGSYWLLDWLAFLTGDYKRSLFSKLSEESMDKLHIIFTYNSKCLVIKLGLFKEWIDQLLDMDGLKKIEAEAIKDDTVYNKSHRELHPKRFNVTKRVYINFLNLVKNSVSELELKEEGVIGNETHRGNEKEEKTGYLADDKKTNKKTSDAENEGGEGEDMGDEEPRDRPRTLLDVLSSDKESDNEVIGRGDDKTEQDDNKKHGTKNEEQVLELPVEEEEDWTADVDDDLLEDEAKITEITLDVEPFEHPEEGIKKALRNKAKETGLSVAEEKFFMKKANRYKEISVDNGQTLEDFIKITEEELKTLEEDAELDIDIITVPDKTMLRNKSTALRKEYVKKIYEKDVAKMFVGVQQAGVALNNFKKETVSGVEGEYDIYSIQLHPVDGEQSTHHIRIPKVDEDGTFMVDGVRSHLQNQRMEQPIRKIDRDRVLLTSYYPNTVMLTRSRRVVDNLEQWWVRQITTVANENPKITLRRGSSYNSETDAPRIYSVLASTFQFIKVGNITLDFRLSKLVKDYPKFSKYNEKDDFLIGVKDNKPLTVNSYGELQLDGKNFNTIAELIGIDISRSPLENVVVMVSGYHYPVGVVLSYYFGIDELLKTLKLDYRTVPSGERPQLEPEEFMLTFNDERLIFNRNEKLATLVFGGMTRLKNLKNFSRSDLNGKGIWVPLMGDPKVRPQHFNEMNNLNDMFIDPITKEELARLKYSQSFPYLIIDAVKMLEVDKTRHEVEIEEQRIVGYERFAGHVYREMAKGIRAYRNKGSGRKHKIDINPEAVITNIITDTASNLVEDVNPIHQIKDQEELTFGGAGGRSDISIVKRSRVQLDSYRGIISEGGKDSGKIGYVTYMTSDPKVTDYRGNIDPKAKISNTGLASVTGNLAVGITKDDPKRQLFVSTQASQAISAKNYDIGITRTGYDNVIAHRTNELYSKVADEDGVVLDVAKDYLEVKYKSGEIIKYPLGLVIGEASGETHRHDRTTDLKKGDKFKKGHVIGFNENWFARDPFSPGQVAWKNGVNARVALLEDQDVYEDSIAIWSQFAEETTTPMIVPRKFTVDLEQLVNLKVKVGDEVRYDSILCEVEDNHLVGGDSENTLATEINRLGIKQVRSTHHGKVVRIEAIYNGDYEGMSETTAKVIKALDRDRKKRRDSGEKVSVNGRVSSNLNVKRPLLAPGRAMFTIFIESNDPSTLADKYVIGNQMKATVGVIFDEPITTADGRPVHIKSSFKGMFNRMVLSLRDKVCTNELAIAFTKKAVEVYRGK